MVDKNRDQATLGDYEGGAIEQVDAVLYRMAPDIITVDDVASELCITTSRARSMMEDALMSDPPHVDVTAVGRDVYHVQRSS